MGLHEEEHAAQVGTPGAAATTCSLPQNSSNGTQLQQPFAHKVAQITAVLDADVIDLWKLRAFAISEGGLVNDSLRRRAWPIIVGLHECVWDDRIVASAGTFEKTPRKSNVTIAPGRPPRRETSLSSINSSSNSHSDNILTRCLDFSQIELDVSRCTWHLLTGTQRAQRLQMEHKRHRKVAKLIRRKQRQLANLINITLVQSYRTTTGSAKASDNTLRYYQGYHDVACIVLSTLAASSPSPARTLDLPAAVLLQISQSHLRDCMRANFAQLQTALRLVLFPLLARFDPAVHEHLMGCEMEPYFCLSWVIAWFSHDIRDTILVKRLFDLFCASHPLLPVYVSVAMLCHASNRYEILQTECDFAPLHQTLSQLPRNSSMVGWKYQPGDGYVSDDEAVDDDCDDDNSVGYCSQSSVDTEFLLHEEALQIAGAENVVAEAVSTVSSGVSSMFEARVPFQELISLALGFMERLPPRNLTTLATRYYGKAAVKSMQEEAPGIQFLITPPAWTRTAQSKLDSEARNDYLLKRGSAPLKECSQNRNLCESFGDVDIENNEERNELLKNEAKCMAVIAAGYGPGDDARRSRKRQRRRMIAGTVLVAFAAIAVGIILQYQQRRPLPSSDEPTLVATSTNVEVEPQIGSELVLKVPPSTVSVDSTHTSSAAESTKVLHKEDNKEATDMLLQAILKGVDGGAARIKGSIDGLRRSVVRKVRRAESLGDGTSLQLSRKRSRPKLDDIASHIIHSPLISNFNLILKHLILQPIKARVAKMHKLQQVQAARVAEMQRKIVENKVVARVGSSVKNALEAATFQPTLQGSKQTETSSTEQTSCERDERGNEL